MRETEKGQINYEHYEHKELYGTLKVSIIIVPSRSITAISQMRIKREKSPLSTKTTPH